MFFLCSGPTVLQTVSEDGPLLHRAAADVTISQTIVRLIKYTVWSDTISLIFVSLTDHNRRKAVQREIEGGEVVGGEERKIIWVTKTNTTQPIIVPFMRATQWLS